MFALLNRMYKQNYKHSNPGKNYNNCLKIMQANDVDGEFILNDWNEILKGKPEGKYICSRPFKKSVMGD